MREFTSFLAALLFGIHPVHTEAVRLLRLFLLLFTRTLWKENLGRDQVMVNISTNISKISNYLSPQEIKHICLVLVTPQIVWLYSLVLVTPQIVWLYSLVLATPQIFWLFRGSCNDWIHVFNSDFHRRQETPSRQR